MRLSPRHQWFTVLLVSFCVGIGVRSFVAAPVEWLVVIGATVVFLTTCCNSKLGILIGVASLGVVLGVGRYELALPRITADHIASRNGSSTTFVGIVSAAPDQRIDHTKLTIAVDSFDKHVGRGNVLVSVPLYPEYNYADRLQIRCDLKSPEPIELFRYDRYLALRQIYSLCSRPQIVLLERNAGSSVIGGLIGLRQGIASTIARHLPEPQAGLLIAMLVGGGQRLPQELNDAFSATGTTHIIAISGMNMTIIVAVALSLFVGAGLNRRTAFYAITILLIGYIVLLGFPASAVRAAIMGWLLLLAGVVGRPAAAPRVLLLAIVVMLVGNPLILRDDVGFQLSVAAMAGLIFVSPQLIERLWFAPKWLGLREALQATLAAQITTLPIIAWHFGRLSLVAPIVNLFVVPVIPIVMATGVGATLVASLFPDLSFVFWPVWAVLAYTVTVVRWFSVLSFSTISI
jgi:competence protein ComEC